MTDVLEPVREQVWGEVTQRAWNQVHHRVWRHVNRQVDRHPWDQVWQLVWDQPWQRIRVLVMDRLADQLWADTRHRHQSHQGTGHD